MNIKSKEDIVRKRNQDLAAENEELKQQLVKIQERLDEILLSNDSSEIRKRIDQLEIIKKEWKRHVAMAIPPRQPLSLHRPPTRDVVRFRAMRST